MKPLPLTRFAQVIGGVLLGAAEHTEISAITTHSGRVPANSAFFALVGANQDGHEFVPAALESGARIVVVSADYQLPPDLPAGRVVVVPDPLVALQRLARWWRTCLSATVVMVTGSNGKTTTKDAMVHFAAALGVVYGSPGSYNSQLGVALALLQCPADCDVAVIEAAGSRPGELEKLTDLIRPHHVVITNVGLRWAMNFPDTRTRIRSILAPAAQTTSRSWLLLGEDDSELWSLAQEYPARVLAVGHADELPAFGAMTRGDGSVSFVMTSPGADACEVTIHTPSVEIVADAQLAMSAAWLLGVSGDKLFHATRTYRPTATRTEIWRTPRGVTLVRDIATIDPIALGSALQSAMTVAGSSRQLSAVLSEPSPDWPPRAEDVVLRSLLDAGVQTIDVVDHPRYRLMHDAAAREAPGVFVNLHPNISSLRAHLLEQSAAGDVVLVQAPRDRQLPDLSVELLESMAATRLYVDLSALEDNLSRFRRLVGPTVQILAMVKALAYGTDSVAVATALQGAGADMLGVSTADEGIALRRHGVHLPILIMLTLAADLDKVLRHGLIPVVYSRELLHEVVRQCADAVNPVTVHLEIDTGMHRSGLLPEDAVKVLADLRDRPGVRLGGLMTHFACADDPARDDVTRLQLERFRAVLRAAEQLGYSDVVRHAAATAGALRFPESRFDMVRIGIGLYGIAPSAAAAARLPLVPVLSLRSRIIELIDVEPGEAVGYGGTFEAKERRRIASVPAGYHDCVPRAFSNHGYVIVDGVRCPIAGTVSMDSMTVDVTGHPSARVGSEVLIYGRHDAAAVPIDEVAEAIGTISYEIMARVGARVQRVFTHH